MRVGSPRIEDQDHYQFFFCANSSFLHAASPLVYLEDEDEDIGLQKKMERDSQE